MASVLGSSVSAATVCATLSPTVGHAEQARPSRGLRYLHCPHRRREVRARRHPVPDLIEAVPQILLEVLDGHAVRPGGTAVRLHALPRLPHQALGYVKRLSFRTRHAHSSPPGPRPVARANKPQMSRPLRSAPITGTSALLRAGPPARAATVLSALRFLPLGALPLAPATSRGTVSARAFPTFRTQAADRARATCTPGTTWPVNWYPPGSSRGRH